MRVIIVCPTPRGGHIEHAANLAASFAQAGDQVTLVSRPGSADYLPAGARDLFTIAEVLAPLKEATGIRRIADRAGVLAREHAAVRRLIRSSPDPALVILEEPRYPVPRILRGRRTDVALVCFIHNVVEHAAHGGAVSATDRARETVKRISLQQYDVLAVHGVNQARRLAGQGSFPIVSAPLPALGWVERSWHERAATGTAPPLDFLCPGELRPNKGIHIAIDAARVAGVPLLVAGKPVAADYLAEITALAGRSGNTTIMDRFLDPVEFESSLRSARAVLLPYVGFDAQSGVMARALAAGTPVIASDLPALREQAAGSALVDFVPAGDVEALALRMREVAGRPSADVLRDRPGIASDDDWNTVTDRIRRAAGTRWG